MLEWGMIVWRVAAFLIVSYVVVMLYLFLKRRRKREHLVVK